MANQWSFLPNFIVRSTGFPQKYMEPLEFTETMEQIRAALHVEEELAHATTSFAERFDEWTDRLQQDYQEGDAIFKRFYKLKKAVEKENSLEGLEWTHPELPDPNWMKGYEAALLQRKRFYTQLEDVFANEWSERMNEFRRVLSIPQIQEAIAHSNAKAWEMLQHFLVTDLKKLNTAGKRKQARTLSRYLQRIMFKNDTTSFFGPLNYGEFRDSVQPMVLERNGQVPSRRRSFMTYWAVEVLAKQVSEQPEWQDFLPISLHDSFYLAETGIVHAQMQKKVTLPESVLAVLRRADGHTPAHTLLSGCSEAVRQTLTKLRDKGLVIWEFRVCQARHEVLEELVGFVEKLPRDEVQQQWLANLQQFVDWQVEYSEADACGKVEILERASAFFEQLTGHSSSQSQGENYADRTLFCEECLGDVQDFALSLGMKEELERKISPLLEWGAAVALRKRERAMRQAHEIFDEMTAASNHRKLPFLAYLAELTDRMNLRDFEPDFSSLVQELSATGKREERIVELPDTWLKQQVTGLSFDERLCFCAPDIMLQAQSVEHVARGEFQWVIGEVHYGTQGMSNLLYFHPQREQFIANVRDTLKSMHHGEALCNVVLKQRAGKSFFVEMFDRTLTLLGRSEKEHEAKRTFSELWVVEKDGELVLQDADGQRFVPNIGSPDHPIAFVFAEPSIEIPKIKAEGHLPRLTYRGLVLQRESWRLRTDEWLSPSKDRSQQYLHVWRQKERLKLPDEVFVRVNNELKPFYVNFRSYFLVDMLLKHLREEEWVMFSELWPDRTSAWFSNEQGTYCCEIRTNIVRTAQPLPPVDLKEQESATLQTTFV
jgi:hypothetical protein